jgi:hypothetical protein
MRQKVGRILRMRRGIVLQLALAAPFWLGTTRAQNGPHVTTDGCAVSGRTLNRVTGEPVRGATVSLNDASKAVAYLANLSYMVLGREPKSTPAGLTKLSLSDGTFCFQTVQAGQYVLKASKAGFLDSSYGAEGYLQTGSIIPVGTASLGHLDIALDPMSGIAGRVIDNYGDGVVDANVVALKQVWYQGRQVLLPVQGTQSDDRGEYRIGKLTPGVYFVYARPVPSGLGASLASDSGGHAVRTYYPSALRLASGSAVSVPAGQDANGINIRVVNANTYHVRGKIDGTMDEWPGATVRLLSDKEEPMSLVFGAGNVAPDGSFDFPNVSPGVYKVDFQSRAGAGQMPIEVEDADVSVALHVTGNATLRGRLVFQGVPDSIPVGAPTIVLKPADAIVGPAYRLNVDSNGSIGAEGVHPGRYFLDVAPPPGLFVESVKAGASELLSREVDLTSGGTVDLTIVFRYGAASLSVTVPGGDSNSSTVSPLYAVLVKLPPRADGSGIYLGAIYSTGQFSFGNVPPGNYRLAALPELDLRLFQNPSFLLKVSDLGTEVELEENANKSIQVSPVPKDVVEQLFGGE